MTETNYAVAPGEYLEEWIDDRGFSQQHVADLLGCSRKWESLFRWKFARWPLAR